MIKNNIYKILTIVNIIASFFYINNVFAASHIVDVGGFADVFVPNTLTIDIGDTVTWNNIGGFHNVNGTLSTFPNNPEGFGNSISSSNWTFSHIFTIPGTYDYQCDPHAGMGMVGQITVNNPVNYTIDSVIVNHVPCTGQSNGSAAVYWSGNNPSNTPSLKLFYYHTFVGNWIQIGQTYSSYSPFTFPSLSPAIYMVQLTDSLTGYILDQQTFTVYNSIQLSFTSSNISCANDTNGAIYTQIIGGNPPYSFLWSNGATTQNLTNLSAGTYTLTVTDSIGCNATQTITLSSPPPISVTTTTSNVLCHGDSDGSAYISISGGVPPYSISSAGFTVSLPLGLYNMSNLSAGTYTFVITDDIGCMSYHSFTITEPSPLSVIELINSTVSCYGFSDGSVSLQITGGNPPYAISWQGVNPNALPAGFHSYYVTDNYGCMYTNSFYLYEPNAITISTSTSNPSCPSGMDGVISAFASGGTPYPGIPGIYEYVLTDDNGIVIPISPQQGSIGSWSGLDVGNYTVTVTDANACMSSSSVTLDTSLTFISTVTDVSCQGIANGSISVVVGGSGNYIYNWTDNLGNLVGVSDSISGLTVGDYNLSVLDLVSGCIETSIWSVGSNYLTLAPSLLQSASCDGAIPGSATVNVAGGIAPYSFQWDDLNAQTTSTASGLVPGAYNCTVIDSIGCVAVASLIINCDPRIDTIIATNSFCNNSDSYADVYLNQDTPLVDITCQLFKQDQSGSYIPFLINNAGAVDSIRLQNLTPGNYRLILRESLWSFPAGYVYLDTSDFFITGINNPLSSASVGINNRPFLNLCNGNISIFANGGVPPYSYALYNNTSNNSSNNTTGIFNGLCSATYIVQVNDWNGCSISTSFILDEVSPPVFQNIQYVSPICGVDTNGSIIVTVDSSSVLNSPNTIECRISMFDSTGTPYVIIWDSVSNFISTNYLFLRSNLSPGEYMIELIDSSTNITYDIDTINLYSSPKNWSVNLTVDNNSCIGLNGGKASFSITQNISTLSYCASGPGNPNDYNTINKVVLIGDNDSISNNTSGICDGYENYTMQFADLTAGQSYSIEVEIGTCNSSGFYAPDSCTVYIDWNIDGDFDDPNEIVGKKYTGTSGSGSPTTHIIPFTVPSAIAVGATRMRVVSQYQQPGVSSAMNPCAVGSFGGPSWNQPWYGATEDYTVVISDSVNNFSFNSFWTGPNGFSATGVDTISGLSAGLYYLSINDGTTCQFDTLFFITPDTISISHIEVINSCDTNNSGYIKDIIINEGTPPYQYSINGGSFYSSWIDSTGIFVFNGLSPGTYTLEVIDVNGCMASQVFTVSQITLNPPLVVQQYSQCINDPNSVLSVTSSNNNLSNTFNWYTDQSLTFLIASNTATYTDSFSYSPGIYSYWVTEIDTVNGCESSPAYIYVQVFPVPPPPVLDTNNYHVCPGAPNPIFTASGVGSNFLWFNSSGNLLSQGTNTYISQEINPGTYSYYVQEVIGGCVGPPTYFSFSISWLPNCNLYFGCTDSLAINYDPLALYDDSSCIICNMTTFFNYIPPTSPALCDGYAIIHVSSNYPINNYNWYNSQGISQSITNVAVNLCSDAYIVDVVDSAGCSVSDTLILGVIYGCTDPMAFNYDWTANVDDGSCIAIIYGCMDSTMWNYNPFANLDDGNCIPFIYGCTNVLACNYDSLANTDDNSCLTLYGCTDINACNYDSLATCDDGSCLTIYGCTDTLACNYNSLATCDDGSCKNIYGCTDVNACNYNPLANCDDNSCLTVFGCTDVNACNYDSLATCDDGSCLTIYGCTDSTSFNYDPFATCDDGSCVNIVIGCTDTLAYNYNPIANIDDGSCLYCDLSTFTYIGNTSSFQCVGWAFVISNSSNNPISYLWSTGDMQNNIGGLCMGVYTLTTTDNVGCVIIDTIYIGVDGCTDSTSSNYDPNATTDDGSCIPCVYGCADPLANNYNSLATCDDGSCIYPPATCPENAPSGLHITEVIQNRATINWDNMNSNVCVVDQYRIRYREQGTNSWSTKTMGQPLGSCLWACNKTDKLILNLTAATTYEYQMKAWYCGGGSSSWTALETFTTLAECPNVGNLAVASGSTTQATFSWDDSNGPYNFMRIKARVDTNNAAWFNVGGTGVAYGTFTKNKNGLNPGTDYRAQARTWCDPNGGAYKSPAWTSLIYWTQPTVIKLEIAQTIDNLMIYPNPSRDIFNISFTSKEIQDLKVRVLNLVGEEVIKEDLQQFVGEYVKKVNLNNYSKGIYFLEIETNKGIINKKLILQ